MARRSFYRGKPAFPEPIGVAARRNRAAVSAMVPQTGPQREQFERDFPESALPALPVKRAPRAPSTEPTENDIQRTILEYLRLHPKIAWAHRFNRGSAMRLDGNGKTYYTKFNTCPGFSDLHGVLRGGKALYVEVKRPGQPLTEEQTEFLRSCNEAGAVAFMATCIEEVRDALVLA